MVTQRGGEVTAVEAIKGASRMLRGRLAEELASPEARVSEDSAQLLKFHGVYAQDDRDVRRERSLAGAPLEYIYMVRVAIPAGRLTSAQWRALDDVAGDLADGTIRLTTRQAVQFHGVAKHGLRPLATALDERLMTSFGGCGDVVRNTVMCPDLAGDPVHGHLDRLAERLAARFKPASSAHWEIFVDGERAASREVEVEHDFYGATYLPRKFKIAIAHPGENCVDVLAQDLGLVPGTHPEVGPGFTVVVGGGLGRSYAQADTFARLADPLTFVTDDEIDGLVAAVLATYRDLGDRTNRRRARMKYVVADAGLAAFAEEVARRYGRALRAPRPLSLGDGDDHLGWREGPEGTWRLGVRVGAGRVGGDRDRGLRRALRAVADAYDASFIITARQDLVIAGLAEDARGPVDAILFAEGVRAAGDLGPVERGALACPALPTCGQALAEAERRLPDVVALIEGEMTAQGVGRRPLQLRMTGCPNGCARPALAEVGVVGRTKSTYDVYLGGGGRGDRLAALYREKVTLEELPEVLAPWLARWRDEGGAEESFGDFYHRRAAP